MTEQVKPSVYWKSWQHLARWAAEELGEALMDDSWERVGLVVTEIDNQLKRSQEQGDDEMERESVNKGVNWTVVTLAILGVVLVLGLCGMMTLLMLSTEIEGATLLAQAIA